MVLSREDEILADEALAESTPVKKNKQPNENANVNGMINDSCKRRVSFELTQSKQQVIAELSKCNYQTPPLKISQLLEELFKEWKSKSGHWLYIAQHWNPREINRNINRLVNIQISGQRTIKNAAAYFTFLIGYRKKRKNL